MYNYIYIILYIIYYIYTAVSNLFWAHVPFPPVRLPSQDPTLVAGTQLLSLFDVDPSFDTVHLKRMGKKWKKKRFQWSFKMF